MHTPSKLKHFLTRQEIQTMKLCSGNIWTNTLTFIYRENVVRLPLFVLLWPIKILFDQWFFYFSVHGGWQRINIYMQHWCKCTPLISWFVKVWEVYKVSTEITPLLKIKKAVITKIRKQGDLKRNNLLSYERFKIGKVLSPT